jgi:GTP-binding protein
LLDISKGSGGDGSGDRSTGADGEDKFIEVPLGTVVRDKREVLFEITEDKFCLEVVRRFRNWHN